VEIERQAAGKMKIQKYIFHVHCWIISKYVWCRELIRLMQLAKELRPKLANGNPSYAEQNHIITHLCGRGERLQQIVC
jgi:hypothetical protein